MGSNSSTFGPHILASEFENISKTDVEEYEKTKEFFIYSAVFLCFILFVAVVLREFLKQFHFPHTVPLLVFGVVLGLLDREYESVQKFTQFAKSDIVIHLFLPVIIYDYSFGMDPHMFVMDLGQCILLALPGFVFCALMSAAFAKYVLTTYAWDWYVCILFGTIVSATDPSAVIDILKDYGVSPSLLTMIEGEAMLNSGVALVASKFLLRHSSSTFEGAVLYVCHNFFGAAAFGYTIAMVVIAILKRSENDREMEVTFSFCTAFITYFISEIYFDISGILAVVTLGVSLSSYKSSMSYEEEESIAHQFWATLHFWANSLLFTIVGVLLITSRQAGTFDVTDTSLIIASYFMICVVRACMIIALTPLLKNCGYGFTWKSGTMLTWGGVRGAIGLTLALITRFSQTPEVVNKLLIQVSGVIMMTLIFNASSMHFLLKLLGIKQITDKNMESMAQSIALLKDTVQTTEKMIRMDKYFSGVDWAWVNKVTQIENPYESKGSAYSSMMKRTFETFRGHCKVCDAEIRIDPNAAERKQMEAESRLLTLRALKTSLSNQLKGHGILRRTYGHLNNYIEHILDVPKKYCMAEDVKRKFLKISVYRRFLQKQMMRIRHLLDIKNRQSKAQEYHLLQQIDAGAFRKRCIKIFLSTQFKTVTYWMIFLNIIPITGEFLIVFVEYMVYEKVHLGNDIVFFEILNGLIALFYVWETIIRIGALGCRTYFKRKSNVLVFFVTVTSAVQILYAIFLVADREASVFAHIYILISLSAVRLLRLLKVLSAGIFTTILNQFCSTFYHAYDLVMGFIIANEEIAKSAYKIVEYDECAAHAQAEAENNVFEMLCYAEKIEEKHPNVVCAWRTHRATVYILKNMKESIEEMQDVYMIDEIDAEELLGEIESKMKETHNLPRYMKANEGVLINLMHWIKNENVLTKVMEQHSIESFKKGEAILETGKVHTKVKVLYKGIIKISGTNTGEKTDILPNTDTMHYFNSKGNFLVYLNSPQPLGHLGYLLQTPSVTRVDASSDCQLITIPFATMQQTEEEFGDRSFLMWRPIALQIALTILSNEQTFENWSEAKLMIHLEEGIFPNLENKTEFDVPPIIVDMVLIQGRVEDKKTNTVYVGPAHIPNTARSIKILGTPKSRPRVVILLLQEERFHARTFMGWVETEEIKHIGLCLVHGLRRMTHAQQINENLSKRKSLLRTFGQLFRPKDNSIFEEDAS